MKNLNIIKDIKKDENITLEEIVTIFKENNVPKNVTLHLIRINFNYDYLEIINYLDLIFNDDPVNPFNKDFLDSLDSQ